MYLNIRPGAVVLIATQQKEENSENNWVVRMLMNPRFQTTAIR